MRLLLINVRGPTSFQHLQTLDGVLCSPYREACQCLGLQENDTYGDHTFEDSLISSNAKQIRKLVFIIFSAILVVVLVTRRARTHAVLVLSNGLFRR
jgi:ATP-dependent DNA helicase PIF1